MAQFPLNGTTQPVDIEEEGQSPSMDRQTDKHGQTEYCTPIKRLVSRFSTFLSCLSGVYHEHVVSDRPARTVQSAMPGYRRLGTSRHNAHHRAF